MFASVLDRLTAVGGRRLLVAAYLPVLLFCAVMAASVYALLGAQWLIEHWAAFGDLKPLAGVVFFLMTIALAYFLLILSPVLSAVIQGANWPAWARRPMLQRQLARRRTLQHRRDQALRSVAERQRMAARARALIESFAPRTAAPGDDIRRRAEQLETDIERLALLDDPRHGDDARSAWLEFYELYLLGLDDGRRDRLAGPLLGQLEIALREGRRRYAAASAELDRRFGHEGTSRPLAVNALGAVFQSADAYAAERYGLDGVTLWPHLQKVVAEDHRARLDDARIAYGFTISVLWLVLLYAMVWTVLVVLKFGGLAAALALPQIAWLTPTLLALLALWPLYRVAVTAAEAYCALHKSCFDLFRFDLLKLLRYKPPALALEEFELWEEISRHIAFGQRADQPRYFTHEAKG